MKKSPFLLLFLFAALSSIAQRPDSTAPYLREPRTLPPFTIQLTDSSFFSKAQLPENRFIVITWFNPECGHCQDEARELSRHIGGFKKAFFVLAAYQELELVRQFSESFGLNAVPNLRIGREKQYFLPVYFDVKKTPFTAVYDKKRRLVKVFENGYTIAELQSLLQ